MFNRIAVLLVTATLSAHPAAQERALNKEVIVSAPAEKVWQAWTTKAGIESFFAPEAEIQATVGGAFHIHINPFAPTGEKGADDMRFLALQPPKMLSFDWNAPPSLPQARKQRTFVVVRLAALDENTTKVTLHHVGWGEGGEWDKAYDYFDRAWVSVLANLKKRFDSGPVDWAPWLAQLKAFMEQQNKPEK